VHALPPWCRARVKAVQNAWARRQATIGWLCHLFSSSATMSCLNERVFDDIDGQVTRLEADVETLLMKIRALKQKRNAYTHISPGPSARSPFRA
jgi:hypothetical protein